MFPVKDLDKKDCFGLHSHWKVMLLD